MLRARRRGMFKREYEVSSDGEPVTVVVCGRREGCTFSLWDTEYQVERVNRRRFHLLGPDGRVAIAERRTGREWTVQSPSGNLTLVKPSIWRSAWEIQQRGIGKGEIRHDGAFKRTFSAGVPADVPGPIAVFTMYVVLVFFERANAASQAGAGG